MTAPWLFLLLASAAPAVVDTPAAPARLSPLEHYRAAEAADARFAAADWQAAADLYARVLASDGASGELWDRLGESRLHLGRYREAAAAYGKALELAASRRDLFEYRLARAWALAGERERALHWLERAVADGLEHRAEALDDGAFAALRRDARFLAAAGAAPAPALGRDRGWASDLARLVAEIRRLHYRYRAEPLPAGFERRVATLRAAIPRLSDAAIVVRLQRLLADLGDGHSVAYFFFGRRALPEIPLRLWWFADGLYVVGAPEGSKDLVGGRVVQIAGVDPEAALARLAPYVSRDNPMFLRAIGVLYLSSPDFLAAAGLLADPRRVALSLAGRDGRRREVTLAPVAPERIAKLLTPSELPGAPPPPLYLARQNEPYWFEPLPEGRTVYFQLNRIADAPGETLAAFMARLTRFLDDRQAETLLVDLRHDFGGDEGLLAPVLRALVHFETARPRARIFVLTSRSTFSAAQVLLGEIERFTHAVFAGEPSSSRANFVGEDVPVTLPWSGLVVSISTRFHAGNAGDPWLWIAPRIPVALTSAQYFANQDPTLDAVLAVVRAEGDGR